MQRDDLPLLAWKQPVRLLLFPLTRRVGKIRHTASKLAQKHGEDANLYWRQVVASNRKHLERVGLSDGQIEIELRAFHDAVQREMVQLAFRGRTGGGAA